MAESIDIRELNERIERQSGFVTNLVTGMNQVIVGQKHLVESLLIGLLSDGHILLEGVPGLGKTHLVRVLGKVLAGAEIEGFIKPSGLGASGVLRCVFQKSVYAFATVAFSFSFSIKSSKSCMTSA